MSKSRVCDLKWGGRSKSGGDRSKSGVRKIIEVNLIMVVEGATPSYML